MAAIHHYAVTVRNNHGGGKRIELIIDWDNVKWVAALIVALPVIIIGVIILVILIFVDAVLR